MMRRLAFLTLTALAFNCAPTEADPVRVPPTKTGPREVAVLGAGCFWGVEAWMMKASGVVDIDVGYAGGKSERATYEQVSEGTTGHAEAVRITFDSSVISYEQLLNRFFLIHDPTTLDRQGNDAGTQYRSAIFPTSEAQRQIAERVKARVAASGAWKKPITTTIEPNAKWVRAEDYHQDYLVKHPGGYDNHWLRDLTF
jgi:methionine-S-sulfoxide reductase